MGSRKTKVFVWSADIAVTILILIEIGGQQLRLAM
jgi:hypothetical protein